MSDVRSFKISLLPDAALALVKEQVGQNTELIHEELNRVSAGVYIGTLVFERYYFRSGNQAALIVIIDNLKGYTDVRLIATAGSRGLVLKLDYGAGRSFAGSVEKLLEDYKLN